MGALNEHSVVVVHLTDKRVVDVINCDDTQNRMLLEDYCEKHNISFMYCRNDEAVRLLVSIGGTGLGVFTNADTDDKNECIFRKAVAFHAQRDLVSLLGAWVVVEPVDIEIDTDSSAPRLEIR